MSRGIPSPDGHRRPELQISTRRVDSDLVVTIEGEIDHATKQQLTSAILGADDAAVVTVDFSLVTFMDSSGIHVLEAAHRHLALRGTQLRLVNVGAHTRRVLEIAGVRGLLCPDDREPA
jgi:anti-anti-sigma factor